MMSDLVASYRPLVILIGVQCCVPSPLMANSLGAEVTSVLVIHVPGT